MKKIVFSTFTTADEWVHLASTTVINTRSVTEHSHDFAEVFWVQDGSGIHNCNGNDQRLHPDELVCIRPGDIHHYRVIGPETMTFLNLAIPWSVVKDVAQRYFRGDDNFWQGTIQLGHEQRLQLDRLATGLAGDRSNRLLVDHFILTLLSFFPQQDLEQQLLACPAWLQKACQGLSRPEHFCHGSKKLAQLSERSHEHVARTLKKHTGFSPNQLVTHYRLRYAAAMLRTTDQPIQSISMDCGFQSLSHFYHIFNKQFGIPPRTYRLGNRSTLPNNK